MSFVPYRSRLPREVIPALSRTRLWLGAVMMVLLQGLAAVPLYFLLQQLRGMAELGLLLASASPSISAFPASLLSTMFSQHRQVELRHDRAYMALLAPALWAMLAAGVPLWEAIEHGRPAMLIAAPVYGMIAAFGAVGLSAPGSFAGALVGSRVARAIAAWTHRGRRGRTWPYFAEAQPWKT